MSGACAYFRLSPKAVDLEMAVGEIPRAFVDFLIERLPAIDGQAVSDGDRSEIVFALRETVGHDFSGYKHSTFDWRVRRRMVMLGVGDFPGYLEHLRADRGEPSRLFRDLLIGVTQFFRDPEAFTALAEKAIPEILKGKTAYDEIRVWSAGCATGEEAYGLAILLHEQASQLDSVPEAAPDGGARDAGARDGGPAEPHHAPRARGLRAALRRGRLRPRDPGVLGPHRRLSRAAERASAREPLGDGAQRPRRGRAPPWARPCPPASR